jgi:hypothetical protein
MRKNFARCVIYLCIISYLFTFHLMTLTDVETIWHSVLRDQWIMNWQGYLRTRPGPILSQNHLICLQKQRKTKENKGKQRTSVRLISAPLEVLSKNFQAKDTIVWTRCILWVLPSYLLGSKYNFLVRNL